MRRNEHIHALVRIFALRLANGDTKQAEQYLKWAYSEIEIKDDYTTVPIDKLIDGFSEQDWLEPKGDARNWKYFIRKYIVEKRPLPTQNAEARIINMKYQDFLTTPYWKSIAHYVKDRAGKKCELCGSYRRLEVHHKDYTHHGNELQHLDDLVCVCRDCHQKLHDKIISIPVKARRRPKTGSALSISAIMEMGNE